MPSGVVLSRWPDLGYTLYMRWYVIFAVSRRIHNNAFGGQYVYPHEQANLVNAG